MSSINQKSALIALSIVVFLILIYKVFDPMSYDIFPKCPFYVLTGYQCPGCGSQRAVHELLNFNIIGAWHQNGLFLVAIPYVFLGLIFNYILKPNPRMLYWRKILFGQKAIVFILIVIVFFWVWRNVNL